MLDAVIEKLKACRALAKEGEYSAGAYDYWGARLMGREEAYSHAIKILTKEIGSHELEHTKAMQELIEAAEDIEALVDVHRAGQPPIHTTVRINRLEAIKAALAKVKGESRPSALTDDKSGSEPLPDDLGEETLESLRKRTEKLEDAMVVVAENDKSLRAMITNIAGNEIKALNIDERLEKLEGTQEIMEAVNLVKNSLEHTQSINSLLSSMRQVEHILAGNEESLSLEERVEIIEHADDDAKRIIREAAAQIEAKPEDDLKPKGMTSIEALDKLKRLNPKGRAFLIMDDLEWEIAIGICANVLMRSRDPGSDAFGKWGSVINVNVFLKDTWQIRKDES